MEKTFFSCSLASVGHDSTLSFSLHLQVLALPVIKSGKLGTFQTFSSVFSKEEQRLWRPRNCSCILSPFISDPRHIIPAKFSPLGSNYCYDAVTKAQDTASIVFPHCVIFRQFSGTFSRLIFSLDNNT